MVAKWYASSTGKSMEEFTRLAQRVAADLPRGNSVLEVAPGPGYFSIELAKLRRYSITGLDISHTLVGIARRNAAAAGVKADFRQGTASHRLHSRASATRFAPFRKCRACSDPAAGA